MADRETLLLALLDALAADDTESAKSILAIMKDAE